MAMDFISRPTTTNNPPTPDSDTDTPPHPPPSKRTHHHFSHHDHHQHVSYKECLKNHAASIGGHALDGCCEFMPGPTFNPFDPTSLICAACGCHRNFHRRDPDDPTPIHHLPPTARKAHSPPFASQLLLSLSGHGNSPSAPSDHEILQNPTAACGGGGGQNGNFSSSKKRFRTKFSQEQKEKMQEFSEKIGWRLKRGEERLVEEFCKQVCVDRNVFKVWMHNNKHSSSSSCGGGGQRREKIMGINDDDDGHKINTITINSSNAINGNHGSNNNNNVGLNNCGGVLSTSNGLEFNFANGGGQEAKAQ